MQHKAELGQKTITKITVFHAENADDPTFIDPSLVFHIDDGPRPPPDDNVMAGADMEEAYAVRNGATIDTGRRTSSGSMKSTCDYVR